MLKALNINFEYQVAIDHYVIDFKVDNIIIEVFGDYRHSIKMSGNKKQKDSEKVDRLQELGFKVVIIWESEIFTKTDCVVNLIKGIECGSKESPQPMV